MQKINKTMTVVEDILQNGTHSFKNVYSKTAATNLDQSSNLHYTRRITAKRVTSCKAHLRGLAPGQHSFEETSQR